MKLSKKRILSLIIFITIVIYGVLKCRLLVNYADSVIGLLDALGFDSNNVIEQLNFYAEKKTLKTNIMGWFIYYPTYIGLHILFIFVVFWDNKKLRNIFLYGFIGVIILLVSISLVSRYHEFYTMYRISYDLFRNLIGLPFVLLFIEGGQILYNDIKKKLSMSNKAWQLQNSAL